MTSELKKDSDTELTKDIVPCPVCSRTFEIEVIEEHVNKCLFLNTKSENSIKRKSGHFDELFSQGKKIKIDTSQTSSPKQDKPQASKKPGPSNTKNNSTNNDKSKAYQEVKNTKPLAETARPQYIDDIVGQTKSFGPGSMLRSMLENKKIPNMILWGPPGCGKTSLANVIASMCKELPNMRFVKLSATMSGINDVKEVVKVAKNEAQFKRQTVLFMDEIHRFNKLQQDTFLPHVENGTITLIGATTENPSFSLNNALLSRCRVVIMEKLTTDNIVQILENAILKNDLAVIIDDLENANKLAAIAENKSRVDRAALRWLGEVCDGDARVALGALELALAACPRALLSLEHLKDGIKRSHTLYDRRGEEHYNVVSALHKAIRASDDNAALYWASRAMAAGEDPLYLARRLVRAACEDIGLADGNAVVEAVACLQGCQNIGMPESDVLLAQCAVRLARAPKSREVYQAMKRCQQFISETKGPLPSVPLHLRNAPTKLMKDIGYGKGYNLKHRDESGLTYMPENMEHVNFFVDDDSS